MKKSMIAVGIALAISTHAFDVSYSQPFSLGPGETAFAVQLPQFDADAHQDTPLLESVTVTLEVTFSGGLTFYNEAFVAVEALGTVESARVLAMPIGSGLLVPAALNMALSDGALVPAAVMSPDPDPANSPPDAYRIDGSIAVAARSESASSSRSTDSAVLEAYAGSGNVAYDVDFTARYPQFITTAPPTLAAILCNDRVDGRIAVKYSAVAKPLPGVILEAFGASWADLGLVVMNWRMGGESNLVGFHIERGIAAGDWLRVTSQVIPAQGGGGTNTYRFEEANVSSPGEVRYRLLAVSADGQTSVLGETVVVPALQTAIEFTADGFQLTVQGSPNTRVAVYETTDVVRGPWVRTGDVTLDDTGAGVLLLGPPGKDRARFYRLVQEWP